MLRCCAAWARCCSHPPPAAFLLPRSPIHGFHVLLNPVRLTGRSRCSRCLATIFNLALSGGPCQGQWAYLRELRYRESHVCRLRPACQHMTGAPEAFKQSGTCPGVAAPVDRSVPAEVLPSMITFGSGAGGLCRDSLALRSWCVPRKEVGRGRVERIGAGGRGMMKSRSAWFIVQMSFFRTYSRIDPSPPFS